MNNSEIDTAGGWLKRWQAYGAAMRKVNSTGDLFGDDSPDRQRAERVEIQERQQERRGGVAQVGDLPMFSKQIDIFD